MPVRSSNRLSVSCIGIPLASLVLGTPASSAWAQSPDQDIAIDVTVPTNSSGYAHATNNSSTYHYKGQLERVTTCPGPDPDGCSTVNSVILPVEIAPGNYAACHMLASVDPCCNDDGNFVLAAKFAATDWRTTLSDPWTALAGVGAQTRSGINEDAGPGHPDPNPNKPLDHGNIQLNVDCNIPGSTSEARVSFTNGSHVHTYRVRLRVQVVCPSDISQSVCGCSGLTTSWGDLCSTPDPNNPPNAALYPRTYVSGDSNTAQGLVCALDPESGWVWCTAKLAPQDEIGPKLTPLNSCCDCGNVLNDIVCGEIDTLEVQKPNTCQDCFDPVNSHAFDKSGKCSAGDIPPGKDIDCFGTDPNAICSL